MIQNFFASEELKKDDIYTKVADMLPWKERVN